MQTDDNTTTAAGGSPVDRGVRPVAQVQRMGSFRGVPHYGCLLNFEAQHRMKVNDPLYGQAELDAAVAAERAKALHDAARWVDEDVGHAAQEGWSVQALQALMATRDMLRAYADMQATTVEVRA
jgi:hypothetical protein